MWKLTLIFAELPKLKPIIVTDKDKYEPGDTLMANCTSSASRPATSLKLLLNNELVSNEINYTCTHVYIE